MAAANGKDPRLRKKKPFAIQRRAWYYMRKKPSPVEEGFGLP